MEGRGISRSGLAKRAVRDVACWLVGVRARRLVGRLERGSADVGIDSGMGSDILVVDGKFSRVGGLGPGSCGYELITVVA